MQHEHFQILIENGTVPIIAGVFFSKNLVFLRERHGGLTRVGFTCLINPTNGRIGSRNY